MTYGEVDFTCYGDICPWWWLDAHQKSLSQIEHLFSDPNRNCSIRRFPVFSGLCKEERILFEEERDVSISLEE